MAGIRNRVESRLADWSAALLALAKCPRLKTGERYLKTIERGKSPSMVNLTSFNAKPINSVKLEWIGEICVTLPRAQIARLRAKAAARARKAKSAARDK